MKKSEYIAQTINKLPKGYIFTYRDFMPKVEAKEAVIKALNRMAAKGKIAKFGKGKYYKPENTDFGILEPKQYQIVRDLVEDGGKAIGYLTGYSIYNSLGLTTQVSNIIQIGRNVIRPKMKRLGYTIIFVRQKNIITKDSVSLLQLLDCIRFIKKIPDTTISLGIKRLIFLINSLSDKDKLSIVRLAMKYPPATRALLGAILWEKNNRAITTSLRESLNPVTKYNLPGAQKVLKYTNEWDIDETT